MQLSKVVGAILNDLSEAQDLANEYSSQLSYKYKKNQLVDNHENVLSNFQVPSAVLSEINLDLKFIIKDINLDGFTLDVEQTQKNCDIKAVKIIKHLIKEIHQSQELKITQNMIPRELIIRLKTSLAQDLFALCHKVFLTGNDVAESEVQKILTDRLDDELLKWNSIQTLLEKSDVNDPDEVKRVGERRKKIREYCQSSVRKETQNNDLQTMIQKIQGSPKTDVIVSPIALSKVAPETIQSLRITAKYNDHRWTISTAESTLS
ncbi:MAG: hypothetical protein QNJ42_01790 [Crocosphaera sp.]|nr:hypothetical protein [Crocosphaera sp.]